MMRRLVRVVLCFAVLTACSWSPADEPAAASKVRSLFDGKTLTNWKSTDFGGQGEVTVKDGAIVMDFGSELTGITWTGGAIPKVNYEIELEAQRVDGNDFFCGLTFPVKDDPCSFIVGGWGGGVVGISSIDGQDAAHNNTTTYHQFEAKKWYKLRVRVTENHISAWIGDEQVVDADIAGKKIGIRVEVGLSKPLGVCCFSTRSALRNIRLRELTADDLKPAAK